jgi:hypothetical protein
MKIGGDTAVMIRDGVPIFEDSKAVVEYVDAWYQLEQTRPKGQRRTWMELYTTLRRSWGAAEPPEIVAIARAVWDSDTPKWKINEARNALNPYFIARGAHTIPQKCAVLREIFPMTSKALTLLLKCSKEAVTPKRTFIGKSQQISTFDQ